MEPHPPQTHGKIYCDSHEGKPQHGLRSEPVYLDPDMRFCFVKCTPDRNNFMAYTDVADTVLAVHTQD